MCRVSLIPSPHSSSSSPSTGEPGTGDSRLVYQNKIAGRGRGVCGCHCLGSSVHVEAKLVYQVEIGETHEGTSQLGREGGREGRREE